MKLKTILTLLFIIFITMGCAATETSNLQEERKKKLEQLNEECDFATVEFAFPEDIYICYKSPSNIKKSKSKTETQENSGNEEKEEQESNG
tara:strand:- start:22 stop:294 length:273 start_codon:yes stop_codon:yes gene_type:complete